MKRLVLLASAVAVVLAFPNAALAAESVSVNAGELLYTSGTGTVDTVTLSDGSTGTVIAETTSPAGSLGKRCSALSMNSAVCTGATRATLTTLDLDDSIVNQSSLPATLDAGVGNDTVWGGAGAETLRGGEGNDVVTAGAGADTVDAGSGDDQIDARDGAFDVVACGDGTDSVQSDTMDFLIGCETATQVTVNPDGTTSTTVTQPGAAGTATEPDGSTTPIDAPRLLAPVTVAGPVTASVAEGDDIAVSAKGVAPLVLGCASDEAKACAGVIFIDPVATKKGKKAKASVNAYMARRGRYGTSPFKVRPGSEDKVDVKLTGIALKALGKPRGRKARTARRGRRVRAVVTIAPKHARAQRVTIVLKG